MNCVAQARPGVRYTVTFGEPAIVANCPRPVRLRFEVIDKITRSEAGFTQGLVWHDGKLLESTGAIGGRSGINVIAPDGTVTNLIDHGVRVFGEGLTVLHDEIFQLTWQDREVLVHDLSGKLERTMQNPRDGWGLTHDGTSLIFSDGGPSFFFADPKTFAVQRAVRILSDKPGDVRGLNALQYVDGRIFGNIYRSSAIVRIDPASGLIDAWADMGVLWHHMTDAEKAQVAADPNNVLNGIAYDRTTGLFYVTGKRWPTIFVGRFSG
jgi:glutaminyl-peptide cyclotransferase